MFANKKQEDGALAICISPTTISWVDIGDGHSTVHSAFSHYQEGALDNELEQLFSHKKFNGRPCHLILHPSQYHLVMTDVLDVPDDEMALAMRWQVKDMFDFDIEELVLDVFKVPAYGVNKQHRKIFVAAVERKVLLEQLGLLKHLLLNVQKVTIADLALSQVLNRLVTKGHTAAMFYQDERVAKILLYNAGNIYMIRQLTLEPLVRGKHYDEEVFGQLLLELQRSYDYCQSELDLPRPTKLVLSPALCAYPQLHRAIQEPLASQVSCLDFNALLNKSQQTSIEQQQKCMIPMSELVNQIQGSE